MDVRLQTRPRRAARTALFVVSRTGLWWVLAVVLLSVDPPVTPPILYRLVLVLVVLPGVAAALLRGQAATAEVEHDSLVVVRDGMRLAVPCEAIAAVEPSRLPLPDVRLAIVLRSGRRVVPEIETDDPAPLLAALAAAGAPVAATCQRASVVAASTRQAVARRWFDHPFVKFGLAALGPAAVLFNAHQHIAHGGLWGEWYTYGPQAWLATLAIYVSVTAIYCVLWASVWRGLGEFAAFGAAAAAPAHAARVRRLVEAGCRLAYWGGIPLVLLLRFLP